MAGAWVAVVLSAAVIANQLRHFMLTDARFRLASPEYGAPLENASAGLSVRGAVYANRSRIQQTFSQDFGASIFRLPLAERQQIIGLPKKRADVILTGVLIYLEVMEQLGFSELRVSTRGLRFAAVMEGV